ncbi:type II toxin-antitoxin system HicA family toxin [Cognataquiflexum rubidum]|uniref:type II toxin-antitoxin system HicA family toxin n=1 Tax=Cognataquiflexum rubidum TaxID=2922273 RepID=UPI001F1323D6|nr:type II toxin-antitoxin system HicA family toxin [Cognataquiflexum rubidum]MCH6236708.1 type II toxin-antitoxin system HicA family toxin [Cognataquiflexum rubidum]
MKSLTPKELIKILEAQGFIFQRSKGSHQLFKHPDGRRTVVPVHTRDLKTGTLLAILKQSGISKEDI